jgi:DNA-binding transcriptional regulator YdaS (Cro superfamily)
MLQEACTKAGGAAKLAELIKAKPQQLSNWHTRGVPEEFCPAIERETGVSCESLRPDIPWHRVADPKWPWHRRGRPVIDVTKAAA